MRIATRFIVVLALAVVVPSSYAGQVWLSGIDPVVATDRQKINMASNASLSPNATKDFMELFHPNAQWAKTAAQIQVFKISTQFFHRSSDEQLSAVINDLRRRHIALALAAEIMATSQACGNGVPGYTTRAVIKTVADRVSRLGGAIDYVAFDSPVAFGHYSDRPTACHFSIPQLVENIAPNIKVLKAAFPKVVFGDIEPVNNHTVGWLNDYLEFAREFQKQTGEKLAFLQADIIWYDRWQPQLVEWHRRVHEAGITYGVVFNGSAIDKSDLEWTQHAVERYRAVIGNPETKPDDVIFQTWHSWPSRFMPENQPGTLTSIILRTVGGQ